MRTKHGMKWMVAALALTLSAGCGGRDLPDLAPVQGTVTLDGEPMPYLMVQFLPEGGGRPSTGTTDNQGHYELTYVAGEMGAKVGMNKVEILFVWPDGEPTPGIEDMVPEKYKGQNTTLSFDVKAGENNVFDIPMTSDAKK